MSDPNYEKRRKDDSGLPPWIKISVAVSGTTISAMVALFLLSNQIFVSRVEYVGHLQQNAVDMDRLITIQKSYSAKEGTTSDRLGDLTVDVAEIKADVGWLRSYLDVSQPPPRRNGKKP